jgi:hypothetical protein
MKKKNTRKMNLSKETLTTLEARNVKGAAAVGTIIGPIGGCQESRMVCSVQHTCVSCQPTETQIPIE